MGRLFILAGFATVTLAACNASPTDQHEELDPSKSTLCEDASFVVAKTANALFRTKPETLPQSYVEEAQFYVDVLKYVQCEPSVLTDAYLKQTAAWAAAEKNRANNTQ